MFFESHAHYDDEAFNADRDELLNSLFQNDIKYIVNASSNISSSEASIELSNKYNHLYAAVGVHPTEVDKMIEEDIDKLKTMCKENSKVVAIGEIGLDYHYTRQNDEIQKYWFEKQIQIAKETNLPVIIHSREASQECFDIIKKSNIRKGVIHCYSGSVQMALDYIQMGFYIGVGGVVTFKNAKKLIDVVETIPLNKILIETDCPYLAPVPNRGKRNDSHNLIYIAEKIGQIKQMSVNKVAKLTAENAKELFNI